MTQSPWRSRQTAHTLSFGYNKHGCKASALAPPFGNAGHLLSLNCTKCSHYTN
jgi:hypothetical protein